MGNTGDKGKGHDEKQFFKHCYFSHCDLFCIRCRFTTVGANLAVNANLAPHALVDAKELISVLVSNGGSEKVVRILGVKVQKNVTLSDCLISTSVPQTVAVSPICAPASDDE